MSEGAAAITPSRARPTWARDLEPYSNPTWGRSLLDIATSVVPYLALMVTAYALFDISVWLAIGIGVLASGSFCVRSSSSTTARTARSCPTGPPTTGSACSAACWCSSRSRTGAPTTGRHHGSAGDLDRRGQGDVPTLTLEEYYSKSWSGRLGYYLFRHPLVMFGIGPIYSLMVMPRFWGSQAGKAQKRSVLLTDMGVALLIAGTILLFGWQAFLLVQMPAFVLAGTAGVWLFYVQHQFEDVYWENTESWSYADAALRGSSYLKLPKVLQFFTGNIGLHHVHHLNARIPNYNLQRAHDENEIFHDVPVLGFWDGIKATRLKVIDESSGSLLTWREARAARARTLATQSPAAETV